MMLIWAGFELGLRGFVEEEARRRRFEGIRRDWRFFFVVDGWGGIFEGRESWKER